MAQVKTVVRRLRAPEHYHFTRTLRTLLVVSYDPCGKLADGEFRLSARTPQGPGSLHLSRAGAELTATTHGPGADWLAEHADAIAGLRDDLGDFPGLAAAHPLVARLARTFSGLRFPATFQVFPRLIRAVLEQKVTGIEAHRAYRAMVKHFGEPAPGPGGLLLPPDPAAVAATAYWVFHPFGVEQRRTQALLRCAAEAARLERCTDSAEATRRLVAIPGIGPWTAAETVRTAYGDADAVSVGDFHIPNTVAWALAGEARGTDARMLELLAPFAGHRGRVCELLAAGGIMAPKFGPRMPIRSFARF
ncbi:3-methyladenine DNA glycosylase [Winogradskya consettensis]|uniref:3-methyladenine DNA glycosylase n=1 Tax=Winogradskya consettensis TaxID=113560 RepID=A0A919T0A3_9ACTN|nr:3-methyladenine DNA glycosylase [Actinoplanes consettensis]